MRHVIDGSSGPVVTFCDTTNISNKTPKSSKKLTNKDIWKSRASVFARLGTKENTPVFNIQKIPPKRKLEGIRNEAIYTDDIFGELNSTSMTMLEDF